MKKTLEAQRRTGQRMISPRTGSKKKQGFRNVKGQAVLKQVSENQMSGISFS